MAEYGDECDADGCSNDTRWWWSGIGPHCHDGCCQIEVFACDEHKEQVVKEWPGWEVNLEDAQEYTKGMFS